MTCWPIAGRVLGVLPSTLRTGSYDSLVVMSKQSYCFFKVYIHIEVTSFIAEFQPKTGIVKLYAGHFIFICGVNIFYYTVTFYIVCPTLCI